MYEMDIHNIENTAMDEKLSRKSKKPLMEKRRRARINNCLLQLKSLVLQAMKKDATHYSKLEKADILEMTVKYLRSIQRRQITSAMAADPTVAAKYSLGYAECANEVARYLGSSQGLNDNVRNRVLHHITGCTQTVGHPQIGNIQVPLQPLHVQIPANGHDMCMPSEHLLVQFPEQSSDFSVQHNSYPLSHPRTDINCESKTFEPVMLPNGHIVQMHSKERGISQQLKCDIYSEQSKFMDLVREAKMSNKNRFAEHDSFKTEMSSRRSSPQMSSSVSTLKDEPLWRPW